MSKGVSPSGFISVGKLQQNENGKRRAVTNAKKWDLIFSNDSWGAVPLCPLCPDLKTPLTIIYIVSLFKATNHENSNRRCLRMGF